jgi:hypothetical protein
MYVCFTNLKSVLFEEYYWRLPFSRIPSFRFYLFADQMLVEPMRNGKSVKSEFTWLEYRVLAYITSTRLRSFCTNKKINLYGNNNC